MFESQYACYHLTRACNTVCMKTASVILQPIIKKATWERQFIEESIELGLQFYGV